MEITLPYTIENATGEKLIFLRIVIRDGIEYLDADNEAEPGCGPTMHVHFKQDECITVVSGKMGYQEF